MSHPLIENNEKLLHHGIVRVPLPQFLNSEEKRHNWANELARVTPLNVTAEDGEYAFYRNIMTTEEDDEGDGKDENDTFHFDEIMSCSSDIGKAVSCYFVDNVVASNKDNNKESNKQTETTEVISNHCDERVAGGISNVLNQIRLDDAFCIRYDESHDDTTCARHMDPSDITVNICLEKSEDTVGSKLVFWGKEKLKGLTEDRLKVGDEITNGCGEKEDDENRHDGNDDTGEYTFCIEQIPGTATLHWGHHSHMVLPLLKGRRTNVILTYCFKDEMMGKGVKCRTCYA